MNSEFHYPLIVEIMKHSIFAVLLFLLVYETGAQSSCLPYGIRFEYQSEIDDFQYNYPGCTEIEGNVEISGYGGINNLDGLNVLTSIGGSLEISGFFMNQLSLEGLNNIASVAGDLDINNNDSLIDLNGLNGLEIIGGDLRIRYNEGLTSLSGLNNLTSVKYDLTVQGNHSLPDLSGLENLVSVGDNIEIVSNGSMTSLNGLGNISIIHLDGLYIYGNPLLSDCETETICDYLVTSSGTINIYNNAEGCNQPIEVANACDTTLSCLPNGNYYFLSQYDIDMCSVHYPGCTELEGIIKISGGDINNLSGLDGINSIKGTLNILSNPELSSLIGLDNLATIDGSLYIISNDQLSSLDGLVNLAEVTGILKIKNNSVLSNIEGLGSLVNMGEEIQFIDNPEVHSLAGLEGLTSVGGGIDIIDMDGLTDLTGLNNLTTVGRYLDITYCQALTNLDALESLTYVGWWLSIYNNYSLENINGLSKLLTMSGSLTIDENPQLQSLEGLNNLDPYNIQDLRIYDNPLLSTCEVESICDYLLYNLGPVNIHDNAPGCNSEVEIEEACESVSTDKNYTDYQISIAPNPVSDILYITSPQSSAIRQLSIYSQTGQLVLRESKVFERIDVSSLQMGFYVIELEIGDSRLFRKLVVK